MKENDQRKPGDISGRKPGRQMPDRGSGDTSTQHPQEIRSKDLGGTDVSSRRTLRGLDVSDSGESKIDGPEYSRETTLAERHPDWPEIRVTLYLTPHATAGDTSKIGEYMQGKHVYFYEAYGGDSRREEWQWVSDRPAEDSVEDFDQDMRDATYEGRPIEETHMGPILRSLYKSGIVVGHADLRDSEAELQQRITDSVKSYQEESFDKTLENLKTNRSNLVEAQEERERIYTIRFEEELGKILDDHPELKEEEQVNVIVTMGSDHKSLGDKFIENGITSTIIIDGQPQSQWTQVHESLLQGRQPSKEDLASFYLSHIVLNAVTLEDSNGAVRSEFVERIVPYFTLKDIEKVHEGCVGENASLEKLKMLLYLKDLPPLPQSNDELAASLEQLRQDHRDPAQRDYYHLS